MAQTQQQTEHGSNGHAPPAAPAAPSKGAAPAPNGAAAPSPAGAAKTISVPERPRLAPGVKLAGQMKESAFKDPPWLIEREGAGYVQVTEPLYRIAEQCDGQRTIEEIASAVSQATGEPLGADSVQRLILGQLIARGLVETADGQVLPAQQARSLLALNLRMKMISPEMVAPFTSVLRVLYWPPILLVLLVVAALAEGWLYYVHGVAGSVHDALYAPGLGLAVLGIMVLAAGLHELGHAAALHYGGGRIKSMGAGLYLVYPAFYTDVSDNYRLSRWSRLRTDFGGFYFNLLTAVGLMALYAATGGEFLLLVVVLINLEIVRQLLPLVRLDGYWILADLTGIPDFFSQMGAFWRSLVPGLGQGAGQKGRELPELKWWGKLVFVVYTLVTVPLLALLLFLMVKGVPRTLATVWDSSLKQGAAFSQAQQSGDGLAMVAAVGQVAALALPTLALLFALFSMARALARQVWNWSKPTPARRVMGGLGTVAAALALYLVWTPQVPVTNARGPLLNAAGAFQPIAPNERGALGDVLSNVVATVPARATPAATPPAAATSRAAGTAAATSPAGTPMPTAAGRLTPQATAPVAAPSTPVATAFRTPTLTSNAPVGAVRTPSPTVRLTR